MLALEQHGVTEGIAFRLPKADELLELSLCWRREMFSNSYTPLWVPIDLDGRTVQGVAFTVNREQDRYRPEVSAMDTAKVVSSASGPQGTNVEYLDETLKKLAELGLKDAHLEEISRELSRPVRSRIRTSSGKSRPPGANRRD